ncbi:type IV secretory system conjugative DNA transfer family protein [Mycolicibacterium vinylchloridicum]|uniref:type IV secretory system conjugative DNA transfer family protein n=1 Tax=Mycolicibacterium vinylchloridicum TaxID=2736928 RepID=UPI002D7F2F1B|nr:type IV secretory system conjugative DNA transfer family protein [Mycolicibacterium vinylchloridicum]
MADSGPMVLVSAPTGTGKTRSVLAPAAVLWGGPVVVLSSKDDLFQLVAQRRYGPHALVDLRPDYDATYPGITVTSFDPIKLITSPDRAVTTCNTMMQMSAVGMGSSADSVTDAGVWEANTEPTLSAMLYAAALIGEGIDWVLLAVDNMAWDDEKLPTAPGWQAAAHAVQHIPLFYNAIRRTLDMDPKQRDSIALTMRKAVSPWMRLSLRGIQADPFDPEFLDDPSATLSVLVSAEGSIAGAAVTLLEDLIKVWKGKTARGEMHHRLLIVIDEATNVAPMPALIRHVGEARGFGVNFVLALQASSQFDVVYGSAYAKALRDIFPAALILFGAPEMDILRRAEEWTPLTTRRQETFDQATGSKTLSSNTDSTLNYRRLLPANRNRARLVITGTAGVETELVDWSEFVALYDAEVSRLTTTGKRAGGNGDSARKSLWARATERHQRAIESSRNAQ